MKTRKKVIAKVHQSRFVKNQPTGECSQLGVFDENVILKGSFTLIRKK